MILKHDNGTNHRTCVAVAAIHKEGLELQEQSSNSPDLVHGDGMHFPELKELPIRGKFLSANKVKGAADAWFAEV